ncbi:DMT family transporter [Dechloromonas sp. ZS-1]|uniref:DMT family transporter n=1 Tax=Dechloromonas sp. ZS-1 TaxID=3138067 RepID=UPI0031FDE07A
MAAVQSYETMNKQPLARLWPSLLLCAAAPICIGCEALVGPADSLFGDSAIGLLCALGALVSWTAYAVGNARALQSLAKVTAHEWNLLTGIVPGMQAIALTPLVLFLGVDDHGWGDWARLEVISMSIAILAFIAGNALWNRRSRLLPLALVGQMILFGTLFALLYGFVWAARLPTTLEMAALTFVVLSVLSCLAAHRKAASIASTALANSEPSQLLMQRV